MAETSGTSIGKRAVFAVALMVVALTAFGGVALAQGGGRETVYACRHKSPGHGKYFGDLILEPGANRLQLDKSE